MFYSFIISFSLFLGILPHLQGQTPVVLTALERKADLFLEISQGESGNLVLENQEDLIFKYSSAPTGSPMKMVFFQNGQLLSSDDPLKKLESWCSLTIKILLDENTTVPKGHRLAVLDVDKPENSEDQRVLSYNFFDFETGKKQGETSRFVPFTFQCSIPKGKVLTYEEFRRITGNRMEIRRHQNKSRL